MLPALERGFIMAKIPTVLGEIDASELGVTMSHEHIIVSNGEDWQHYPWRYDRQKTLDDARNELTKLKASGVDSIIDLTTPDLGRDIEFMVDAAQGTGIHVIAATGIWRDPPRSIMEREVDDTADIFVHEIEQGIGNTSVRAGAIKVANDIEGFTPAHVRILQAAARACARTGCPISTHHNASMQMGTTQVRIFKEEGAPMDRVAIGHSADTTDIEYLESLLKEGVYLSLDRYPGRAPRPTWEQRNQTVKALIDRGWGDKLMLGQDGWVTSWFRAGDPETQNAYLRRQPEGMSFLARIGIPGLLQIGVTQDQVDVMMRETPRRFLTGQD
jgi:phosphotriesterase-related protein